MKNLMDGWKEINTVQRSMAELTMGTLKKMDDLSKVKAFTILKEFAVAKTAREAEQKEHASSDLGKLLNSLYLSKLSSSFNKIRTTGLKHKQDQTVLKRVFSQALNYRLQYFFDKWKHTCNKIEVAEQTNAEGEVAVELDSARKKADILKGFLHENGHADPEISKHLEESEQWQRDEMKRFVIAAMFRSSKFQILPKALNQLKAWKEKRKQMKEKAITVLKYIHSDTFHAF